MTEEIRSRGKTEMAPEMPKTIKVSSKSTGARQESRLLKSFVVSDDFVIGAYEGTISEYDIIIKYRQKIAEKWTKPRQPKHIHWAVDLLLKMQTKKKTTVEFINFLRAKWNAATPLKSHEDRENFLSGIKNEELSLGEFQELEGGGEYSVAFLYKLAQLLMTQEKSNRPDAYMFSKLLDKLSTTSDIYSVVATASLTKRG
jgi:hypothetical protein